VPILALVVLHPLVVSFMGPSTVLLSGAIHGTFITLECIALLLQIGAPEPAPSAEAAS
jgi:hypothetical protein